ncbi:MAG: septal ring lytic transglycosylase RlpA family protein [Candidatus Sulfotelmatobacter sp.]
MESTKYLREQRRQADPILCAIVLIPLTLGLLSGCGHPKQTPLNTPPPPLPEASSTGSTNRPEGAARNDRLPGTAANDADMAEPNIPRDTRPLTTETGRASWYGPPYHNRVGSNGEVYNMHAMTAAHRTLPLGTIVRVTNLKTGHQALVRITDRGPFIPGRILDLSLAAARKLDVYLPGVAEVKIEVMQTPAPLEVGGKWAVQIGSFAHESQASKFADHLARRYRAAKVQHFGSPVGDWWVRVRVLDDDRKRAQQVVAETTTPEGAVFLVRLD